MSVTSLRLIQQTQMLLCPLQNLAPIAVKPQPMRKLLSNVINIF